MICGLKCWKLIEIPLKFLKLMWNFGLDGIIIGFFSVWLRMAKLSSSSETEVEKKGSRKMSAELVSSETARQRQLSKDLTEIEDIVNKVLKRTRDLIEKPLNDSSADELSKRILDIRVSTQMEFIFVQQNYAEVSLQLTCVGFYLISAAIIWRWMAIYRSLGLYILLQLKCPNCGNSIRHTNNHIDETERNFKQTCIDNSIYLIEKLWFWFSKVLPAQCVVKIPQGGCLMNCLQTHNFHSFLFFPCIYKLLCGDEEENEKKRRFLVFFSINLSWNCEMELSGREKPHIQGLKASLSLSKAIFECDEDV